MDATERDDVRHALCATMDFFGKKIDAQGERIWFAALRGHAPDEIRRALSDYTKQGRYAPKPVDILELLGKRTGSKTHSDREPVPCPDHIRDAWAWFNRQLCKGSILMDGVFSDSHDVDPEMQEKYLLTVNEQAKLYNQTDAIPDEYKLKEVWG